LKAVGKCYRLITDGQTWEQGMASCATSGGDLAKITSQQETDAIVTYIKSLGATAKSYCSSVWIAAQRLDPNSCSVPFVWKTAEGTNSALRYSYWYPGEPNCYGNAEKCAMFYTANVDGQWYDDNCAKTYCSLCQA